MANPTAPGVVVPLGGEERRLLLDFNALAELEERGVNLLGGFARADLSAKNMRAIVWAACLRDQPDLTEKEVGAWLTPDRIEEVTGALLKLFGVTMPEPEPEEPGRPLPAGVAEPAPTG